MRIAYLDLILSTCFTLRKVTSFIIKQNPNEFNLRPQLHVMIIAPFGSGKSSFMKKIGKKFSDSVFFIDDFTKASIDGSIDRTTKEYVPSLLTHCGGKVLVIDEWNSIDYYGQSALLSVLENQKVLRSVGFKVLKPYEISNKYMEFSVQENIIKAKINFSCIACAMEFPLYEQSQRSKALLSRFSPLFLELDEYFLKAVTSGDFEIDIKDYSSNIEEIGITSKCYHKFNEEYWKYIEEKNIIPDNSDDKGYCTRIMSDIVRLGVFNYIQNKKPRSKSIIIDNCKYFDEVIEYADTFMLQFMNPKTKGKIFQYKDLLKKYPNKDIKFYAWKLGVTERTIFRYDEEIS